ncbi:MAG: hypothetical protein SV760_04515 [Halobacteria archaeon]|nr:hypothetical protein [Halobacteria archaeon]
MTVLTGIAFGVPGGVSEKEPRDAKYRVEVHGNTVTGVFTSADSADYLNVTVRTSEGERGKFRIESVNNGVTISKSGVETTEDVSVISEVDTRGVEKIRMKAIAVNGDAEKVIFDKSLEMLG